MRAALTLTALLAASPGCVDASAAPATTTVRAEDDLKRVFFSRSSARIRAEGRRSLDQNVAILKEHPRVDVVIVGHADDARSEARNEALAQARAEAVAVYLADSGIDTGRFLVRARGDDDPIAESSADCRFNRRVEFRVSIDPGRAVDGSAGNVLPDR